MQARSYCFLIDNDEDDREIFSMALREADPEVDCLTASTGVEAVQNFKGDTNLVPLCIFVDMNMPMMNGKECLKELRQLAHLESVPVYMYSTSSDPFSVSEVKHLGATGFLVKPSSFAELTAMLTRLMREHKALI
jgi:DNA-binding response OmpR family regulator